MTSKTKKKTRHFHAGKLRKDVYDREFVSVAESGGCTWKEVSRV